MGLPQQSPIENDSPLGTCGRAGAAVCSLQGRCELLSFGLYGGLAAGLCLCYLCQQLSLKVLCLRMINNFLFSNSSFSQCRPVLKQPTAYRCTRHLRDFVWMSLCDSRQLCVLQLSLKSMTMLGQNDAVKVTECNHCRFA